MYAALLDANVLVPTALCDTLLRLAGADFYRPLWSERILSEVEGAILGFRPDLDPERVHRRVLLMAATFEDASVEGWEQVSAGLDLPDPDDRHVLAAAISGGAQAIVTANLEDFPDDQLRGHGIEARHPDDFLLDQLDLFPGRTLDVARAASRRSCASRDRPRRCAEQPGELQRAELRRGRAPSRPGRALATVSAASEDLR